MTDHQQSESELKAHLDEQLSFLQASASGYDAGYESEAKRIAVAIRVLVHDTARSASLLSQLGLKNNLFLDTSNPISPGNITPHSGLIVTAMAASGAKYCAFLDEGITPARLQDFESWWHSHVFVDSKSRPLSRRELVLSAANQDGGAHIDPTLNAIYADLSRHNSLGWTYSDGSRTEQMGGPEKAALRQICHEVLKTLVPGYAKAPTYPSDSAIFGGFTMHMVDPADPPPQPREASTRKVGRNERCICGSGVKYKKCCGALV